MRIKDYKDTVLIPEDVSIEIDKSIVTVKGPKGELKRDMFSPGIEIKKENGKISLSTKVATKKEKRQIATYVAHLKNMIRGVRESHIYKLKICSGHFPMNVTLSGNEIIVKNFLGETVPRKVLLPKNVDVKIEGDIITVNSISKELAGQAAANIEQLTRITNRDRRIFQDGIYIISKDGKEL